MIDPNNPFKFANWMNDNGKQGGTHNGDDIEVGQTNTDSDFRTVTLINTASFQSAALAGDNTQHDDLGGVGVFGRSHTTKQSIGVAGESETGCGVYGIATDGNTIGVAGRSMGGDAVEDIPLEEVIGEPVGVLGHSTKGPGVRGHGGPLLTLAHGEKPPPAVQAAPGGTFSSGKLQDVPISVGGISTTDVLSIDILPQLRLIPSVTVLPKLPAKGQLGDLYVNVATDNERVFMFLCVVPGEGTTITNVAKWAPFQLGNPQPGDL